MFDGSEQGTHHQGPHAKDGIWAKAKDYFNSLWGPSSREEEHLLFYLEDYNKIRDIHGVRRFDHAGQEGLHLHFQLSSYCGPEYDG